MKKKLFLLSNIILVVMGCEIQAADADELIEPRTPENQMIAAPTEPPPLQRVVRSPFEELEEDDNGGDGDVLPEGWQNFPGDLEDVSDNDDNAPRDIARTLFSAEEDARRERANERREIREGIRAPQNRFFAHGPVNRSISSSDSAVPPSRTERSFVFRNPFRALDNNDDDDDKNNASVPGTPKKKPRF